MPVDACRSITRLHLLALPLGKFFAQLRLGLFRGIFGGISSQACEIPDAICSISRKSTVHDSMRCIDITLNGAKHLHNTLQTKAAQLVGNCPTSILPTSLALLTCREK